MLNALAISSMAVKGMEAGLEATSEFLATVDTQYAKDYEDKKVNTGQTIEIVLPPRPNDWVEGRAMTPSPTEHERVSLTVRQFNTGREISSAELKLSDKEFMEEVVKSDNDGAVREAEIRSINDLLKQGAMGYTGSVGVRANSSQIWQRVAAQARLMLMPPKDVCALLEELTMAELANNAATLFRPGELVDAAALEGRVEKLARVGQMYSSVNIGRQENGAGNTTGVQVVGGNQSGSTLNVDGCGTGSYKAGQQFYLPSRNALDPTKKKVLSFPQTFTLTEDAVITAGAATLKFAPAMIITGSLKNVVGSPADDAAVVFLGNPSKAYRQNLLYQHGAVAFVGLSLPAMEGQGGVVKNGKFRNIPVSTVAFTDWMNRGHFLRYDLFFGACVKRYQHFWRVWDLEEAI